MEKYDRIPLKRVKANELGDYKGHWSKVKIKKKTVHGEIIHVNATPLYVYVYLLTKMGTAICGRYPRWHTVPVSVEAMARW